MLEEIFIPTPLNIALLMLKPPFIYIIIGLILFGSIIGICFAFWETFQPCIFVILDIVAVLVRTAVATGKAFYWCTAYIVFPIKETLFGCIDGADVCLKPYKKKNPLKVDVPFFQYV
mmetsp:Transcript_123731/g.246289  ORF Transcript_123731/g.246289 Transcript_123731/m.246289 type:complete len:117 (+) Transcript_123731:120-470(+)